MGADKKVAGCALPDWCSEMLCPLPELAVGSAGAVSRWAAPTVAMGAGWPK